MAIVYTFGANEAGIHGKGSALEARRKHGAIYGQGEGRQGNSYGIPTKKTPYISLSIAEIDKHVQTFIQYATEHPEDKFNVVRIGCNNAGYTDAQIAPMFQTAPPNVFLPDGWRNQKLGITMDDLYDAK
jgi:hypothetical protein